jgi:hypothetical protein
MSLRKQAGITATALIVSGALLTSCSQHRPAQKKRPFQLPSGFVTASPGGFSILASAPMPGGAPDEREGLRAPVGILPAADGGLIVVTQNHVSAFTWITNTGQLRPYFSRNALRYSDGTSPAAAVSAYRIGPTTILMTTADGELVRITTENTKQIGQLPTHTDAAFIGGSQQELFLQQNKKIYHGRLDGDTTQLQPYRLAPVQPDFTARAMTPDGRTFLADDGRFVVAISRQGKVVLRADIGRGHDISSVISDNNGGAWVGTSRGGIVHLLPNGKTSDLVGENALPHDCLAQPRSSPIGSASAMLLRDGQLYVADTQCDTIAVFGVPRT